MFYTVNLNPYFGVIQLSGANVATFLQGQLTCDLRTIDANTGCFGAYCDHKGRVLTCLYLCQWQTEFYLLVPKELVATAQAELHKFGVFSQVSVHNQSHAFDCRGYFGREDGREALPWPKQECGVYSTTEYLIFRLPDPNPRFIVLHPAAQPIHLDAASGKWAKWQALNIEAGIAEISAATTGLFTPHMLNYPALHAVSFTKGCYRGQEVISRTEHLGQSKRHLYRAKINSAVSPGLDIIGANETPAGKIVTCAPMPEENSLLAVLSDETTSQPLFCRGQALTQLERT